MPAQSTDTAAGVPASSTQAGAMPVWQLALIAVGAVLVTTAGLWYLLVPEPPTASERLALALELLDAGRDRLARETAEQLEAERYQDVEFAGGIDYVLGVCHFREAMQRTQTDSGAAYATAVTYLLEAERLGIPAKRRPEYVYALATSLLRVRDRVAALPLLEEACHPTNPHHTAAAIDLVDLYLDPSWRTDQRLQAALRLNALILDGEPTPADRLTALQQRVDILLAQNEFQAAETTIDILAEFPGRQLADAVLRARLLMGREEYVAAVNLLEPVAREDQLDRTYPRQACYLLGLAAERRMLQLEDVMQQGERRPATAAEQAEFRQRAVEYYTKTVNRFDGTHEALAAYVRLGRLQQDDGAAEKAIQSFGTALRSVKRAEEFSNRWMGLEEFRQRILAAWNRWIDDRRFPEAIALADMMTPAFPRDQAYELAARARQRWAEQADAQWARATTSERAETEAEHFRLWRESAAAYARLAQARRTAANYSDAVWLAAEHYYRGRDFQAALENVNRFLEEAPAAMRPVALVRRGQILLDLDRLDEAEEDFRTVRRRHATSPAAFTAAFQLAICRLEQDDADGAEAAWRSIVTSTELSPSAIEWRDALLSLARLQTDRASWSRRQLERDGLTVEATRRLWNEVDRFSSEAAELLEQYVSRYPASDDLSTARYSLGKVLQLQGDVWRRNERIAETENAREQARSELQNRLQRALHQFAQVRDMLSMAADQDRLSAAQQALYQNAWFEYPHTLFSLGQYQDAVTAYGATIHRFPQDVRVLTAYLQMAEAYAHLQRPIEARSMLEQARVILDQKQIPATAFTAPTTNMSRVEWEQWLDRARRVHQE